MRKIVILAILIRLLVMPFYFHPDIKTYNFQSSFLQKGIIDIYSYLPKHKSELPLKEEFVYFPLTYFFLGGYQLIASPFLGSEFNSWLSDASQTSTQNGHIFRYLFILKLPYLILDLVIGLLLYSLFKKEEQRKKVLMLWLFNPLSVFLIYAFSNLDVIVVFLTLLSVLLAQRGKLVGAALALGVGAGFKAYPLIFVPFLLLSGKNIKERVGMLLASLMPLILIIGPFLKSTDFRQATLTSGLMTRLTLANISLSFGESLMMGVVILSAMFFYGLTKFSISREKLMSYYLASLLTIFSLIHFHIQWLLWVLPFVFIAFLENPKLRGILIGLLSVALIIPLLYEDKAMTVGLFSAINPLFNTLPTPFVVLQKIYDPYLLQSLLHSVFAGGSIMVIWQLLKEKNA